MVGPTRYEEDEDLEDFAFEYSTAVAQAVVLGADEDQCFECARKAFLDLDFSSLSSASAVPGHRPGT
jgi:hypothetical protein